MREYRLKLRFVENGKSLIKTHCNGQHLVVEDTNRTISRVWRKKLRLRAKELLSQQPDGNFSIEGVVVRFGEERSLGIWHPGEKRCWFGDTVEERGISKPRRKGPSLEAEDKWTRILKTARPL